MSDSPGYVHGFTEHEVRRLHHQARFLEHRVHVGLPFHRSRKLLEVGAGVGAQTEILLRHFPELHVVGVEASAPNLEAARRFLAHFRPAIGVFVETEVWPVLLAQCRVQGVPTVLANARMSEISVRKAARLRWLSRPAFAGFAAVLAQTARDAERLGALGAREPRVCGSVKYDARPDAELLARGRAWARMSDHLPLVGDFELD